jgi:hypothetical protein
MGFPKYNHRMDEALATLGGDLASMSRWIDEHPANKARTPLENLLLRTSVKMHEEKGEVNAALIGMTGQNPRKRTTHTMEDVEAELLDWAVVALGAVEHIHGNDGSSMIRLADKVSKIVARMEAVQAEKAQGIADLKASAKIEPDPELAAAMHTELTEPIKGCEVAFYNAADTSLTYCSFEDGHDRIRVVDPTSADPLQRTMFDHGNVKAKAYWNNDSKSVRRPEDVKWASIDDIEASATEFHRRNDLNRSLFYGMIPAEKTRLAKISQDINKNTHQPGVASGFDGSAAPSGDVAFTVTQDVAPAAKEFFAGFKDDAEQAVKDNPEIYNPDGTAR